MSTKWNCETTTKFIQEYKCHECLWDFKSANYKNKRMREAAYLEIVKSMNLTDCGVHEVKNKIKNLRSTYNQEIKKIEDSMKSGTGHVYTSNIKWLKELAPVYKYGDQRKAVDDKINIQEENTREEEEEKDALPLPPPVKKKKTKDITRVENKKYLHESIDHYNECERDASDVFGKSVAMQLKKMTEERALLAKCKIQTILTEYGIADLNDKKRKKSSYQNFSTLLSASPHNMHSQNLNYSIYESRPSPVAENNTSDPFSRSHPTYFKCDDQSPDNYENESTDNKDVLATIVANSFSDQSN